MVQSTVKSSALVGGELFEDCIWNDQDGHNEVYEYSEVENVIRSRGGCRR